MRHPILLLTSLLAAACGDAGSVSDDGPNPAGDSETRTGTESEDHHGDGDGDGDGDPVAGDGDGDGDGDGEGDGEGDGDGDGDPGGTKFDLDPAGDIPNNDEFDPLLDSPHLWYSVAQTLMYIELDPADGSVV